MHYWHKIHSFVRKIIVDDNCMEKKLIDEEKMKRQTWYEDENGLFLLLYKTEFILNI